MMHHDCEDLGRQQAWRLAARALKGRWQGYDCRHGSGHGGGAGAGPGGVFAAGGPFDGLFGPRGPFGPGGRGGGPGGGRRGPGRGRLFSRDELRLLLLRLIAEAPRHGYDLIKAMEDRSGGHYSPSPGVVYPALAMLADEGLIAEQDSEGQRRKFAITEAGTRELEALQQDADRAMERLTDFGEHAERHRAPSIERAAMNLFTAVGQRMRAGSGRANDRAEGEGEGWDKDLPHRIAEILDEAAQRIERL